VAVNEPQQTHEGLEKLVSSSGNLLNVNENGKIGVNYEEWGMAQFMGLLKPRGAALVSSLIHSHQTTKIFVGEKNATNRSDPNKTGPTDADVMWSPSKSADSKLIVGSGKNTRTQALGAKHAHIGLGHELVHGLRITKGWAKDADKQSEFHNVFNRPADAKMVLEKVKEEEFFTIGLPGANQKARQYGSVPSHITEVGLRREAGLVGRIAESTEEQAASLPEAARLLGKGKAP
jgi:hypothetical protein